MKPWQKGIALEELQAIAQIFREHDEGLILGAFTGVNEAKVADWLTKSQLGGAGDKAAIAWRRSERAQQVKDFRGQPVCRLPEGAIHVERIAFREGGLGHAREMLIGLQRLGPLACLIFQEHPGDRQLVEQLGLRCAGVKIRASSELIGIWTDPRIEPSPLPRSERVGLAKLQIPPIALLSAARALRAACDVLPAWADHYSSYNERGSWKALSLRGFGSESFIEKPAEMSKRWQAEHPELLDRPCLDTPLRALLPSVEQLLAAIPGGFQRIRLMRVEPGGALSRHADITDREAGIQPGSIARIHIPIQTNPGVRFASWGLDGMQQMAHMAIGEAWYLDTRKPHAAWNAGKEARIHLVADAISSPQLARLLP